MEKKFNPGIRTEVESKEKEGLLLQSVSVCVLCTGFAQKECVEQLMQVTCKSERERERERRDIP